MAEGRALTPQGFSDNSVLIEHSHAFTELMTAKHSEINSVEALHFQGTRCMSHEQRSSKRCSLNDVFQPHVFEMCVFGISK